MDCPTEGQCVSNDASMAAPTITGPSTCVVGEPITVTVATSFTNQGQNTRYATGIFVNALGNAVSGQAGQCVAGGLPVAPGEEPCGDLGGGAGVTESLSFTTAEVICNGSIGGPLVLNTMGVWSQNPESSTSSCPARDAISKCSAQAVTTSIIVEAPAPALAVTKTASPLVYTAAGQTITYTYTVTNTGNVTLANVILTDDKIDEASQPTMADCNVAALDPGDSTECTASYIVTATDFASGSITNVATAAGSYKDAPVNANATATVNAAKLTLEKSASPTIYEAAGTLINYSFMVTNTGLVDLTTLAINDPTLTALGVTVTCPTTTLAAGAYTTCTASYTTTATDFANLKTLVNTASATGSASGTTVTSNTDDATVIAQAPAEPIVNSMTITKSASPTSYSAAGVVITYTFTVTNTGEGTINDIIVTDNVLGVVSGCATTLAAGASTTCTKTYTTTQADLDADKTLLNTATVKGTPAEGIWQEPQPSALVSVDAIPATALNIDKQAITLNYNEVGDVINYTYTVTNNSNITLASLVVTDNKIAQVVCSPTVLAPTAVATCTGSYITTQEDVDAGSVVNLANATAQTPQNTAVNSAQTEETVPAEQRKSLSLDKTSDPKAYTQIGEVIKYEFIVTNTGNTTLKGPFSISDPTVTGITCPSTPTSLTPGAALTCTASYSITQADMDKGQVSNTATASGGGVTSNEDTNIITTQKLPSLTLKKTFTKFEDATTDAGTESAGIITVGDKLFYDIVVTNSGNVTLTTPILVNDPLTGLTNKECAASLAPKATCAVSVTYIVTKTDASNGSITNTAIATSGDSSADGSATVFVTSPAEKIANITLVKTMVSYDDLDKSESVTLNDKLYYKIVVTNTGQVDLTGLVISDPVITITANTCTSTLKIGASCAVEGFHLVSDADVSKSKVENTAVAKANELASEVRSNTLVTAVGIKKISGINLTKSQTNYDDLDKSESVTLNDKLYYKIVVTNTGQVDLTGLVISDPVITITANTCTSTLTIGASCVVEGFHIVTANDVSNTKVENTATAKANELTGQASSNTVVIGIGVAIPIFGPLGLIITLLGLYAFGRRRAI